MTISPTRPSPQSKQKLRVGSTPAPAGSQNRPDHFPMPELRPIVLDAAKPLNENRSTFNNPVRERSMVVSGF
jgi:hypothetical protein